MPLQWQKQSKDRGKRISGGPIKWLRDQDTDALTTCVPLHALEDTIRAHLSKIVGPAGD